MLMELVNLAQGWQSKFDVNDYNNMLCTRISANLEWSQPIKKKKALVN